MSVARLSAGQLAAGGAVCKLAFAARREPSRNPMTYLRKRPRQRRARETVEAIVEAAARILAEHRPAQLTTNRIAERAGVSVGSLYQYFPDRRAVIRALYERELARAEALRPAVLDDPTRPLAERLRAAVDWHFDVHAANPALAKVLRLLVREVLPASERGRLLSLRAARVRATVAGATALAGRHLDHAAFVVDVCLDALADATAERHPDWASCAAYRAQVTRLLVRYLDGLGAGAGGDSP
jgi:AcrR family transcriptional regulator